MQRRAAFCAFMSALCACASVSYAKDDEHAKDHAVLLAECVVSDTAAENNDADMAVLYAADDFTETNEHGIVEAHNKAEERDEAAHFLGLFDKRTSQTTISDIQFTQDIATLTETSNFVGTKSVNGKTLTYEDKSTLHDVWIKSGSVWLQKSTVVIIARRFVNGKSIT